MANSEQTEIKQNKRGTNPNSLANLIARNGKNGRKEQPKEFKDLVKAHSIEALKTVIEIMNNPDAKPTDRLKASEMIIDRAYGKATQPIAGDGSMDAIIIKWADTE